MFEAPDLSGRVAIVTGASRGIGRAVAIGLAKAGCAVVVAARTERGSRLRPGSVHETVAAIAGSGGRASAAVADVRDAAQVGRLVADAVARWGRLDIAVANAGGLTQGDVVDTPVEAFDRVMAVNVRAAYALAHHATPHLLAAGGGHFIAMAPPLAPDGRLDATLELLAGRVAYAISKLGMTLLVRGLADELAGRRVAAWALWPSAAVASLATAAHGIGAPARWRRPEIVADAVLALVARDPGEPSGQGLLDEEVLAAAGVRDLAPYQCEIGTAPLPLFGPGAPRPRSR